MMLCTTSTAHRIEFAGRVATSSAIRLGWAATPSPDTPGRPSLRSLSEATNYDQPQVRILLGVLFCGDGAVIPINYCFGCGVLMRAAGYFFNGSLK